MSYVKVYSIHCDLHPAAHDRDQHGVSACTGWTGEGLTLPDARQQARRTGWARIKGKDYCPAAQEVVRRWPT